MRTCCLLCLLILATATCSQGADDPVPVIRLTTSHFSKFFLRYSPDGSHLVYCRHYANRRASGQVLQGLHIVRADGSHDRRLLTEYDRDVQIQEHPAWSPDGKRLVISGGGNDTANSAKDLFICDLDASYRATQLRKIIPGTSVNIGEEPCWSPDGKQLCAVSTAERLLVVDADGKNLSQILQVDGSYCHQPDWSPDGQWIAFATDRDGNVEVYKVRVDGTELTRLTNSPGLDSRPRWSPDGRWLTFTSNRDGNYDIFLMRDDGQSVRPLTRNRATDDHAAWSPDGKSIAFVSMRDGGFDLYRATVPDELQITNRPPVSRPEVAAGDLILHYSFDDTARDSLKVTDLARRHTLDLQGARLTPTHGSQFNALTLDGASSFASAGNAVDLRMKGPFTISLWVNPEPGKGNGYLVSKHGWNIYLGSDLIPRFETRTAADQAWDTLSAKQPLPAGSWSFLACVFDPGAAKLRIYINGELSAESPRTDGAIGSVESFPLVFGHYVATRTQAFQGQLDEIRLDRRALSAADLEDALKTQRTLVLGP